MFTFQLYKKSFIFIKMQLNSMQNSLFLDPKYIPVPVPVPVHTPKKKGTNIANN